MKPDDPAFPIAQLLLPGLTKREYAAIMAMQGILAHHALTYPAVSVAELAIIHADVLLKELAK